MKKVIVVFAALLLFAASVAAQNTGITSVFNWTSEGVFTNELDAAVTVEGDLSSGPDFRSLGKNYIFAGLANLEFKRLRGDSTFSYTNPLWAGYYSGGEKPWSAFGAFGATGTGGNLAGGTTYTQGASVNVTSGTTTTTYQWNVLSSTKDYTANRIFDDLNLSGQYLFTLGKINTGLFANVDLTNSDPQANNYKQTDIIYYNSAGAGVEPAPLVDYNHAVTRTSRNNTSKFTIAVPFFIPGGDSSRLFNVNTSFEITDNSTTFTESYSGTPNTALGAINTTVANDVTAREVVGGITVDYTYKTKGIWGKNSKDKFWVDGNGAFTITGGEYGSSNITQDISAAGGGAAFVDGARSDTGAAYEGILGIETKVGAGVGHSFYYDLGSGVGFGAKPESTLDYTLTIPEKLKSITTTAKTDGDADGLFTSAADTIVTTTANYTNTSFNFLTAATGNAVTTNKITCSTVLPMAVTFTPPKWPITFILGSKPSLSMVMTFTGTKTSTTKTTTVTKDGTGAVTGTTVTNEVTADETSSFSTSYSMSATHNIGFSMDLSNNFRLDVSLDMSSDINVLDFKNLSAQAIISLP